MPSPHKKSFAAEQLARQKRVNPVVWVIVSVVIVAVLAGGYMFYRKSVSEKHVETETQQIKSIAVLPFVDMSAEKDQEWFCDGISEAILNALTHVGNLRVPGRTSSFSFKEKDASFAEIGRELNVESVLEGSIVKSGKRLRITAQLIKADDGFHIWSETYKRETEDVFPLIEEISIKVVEALKVKLLSNERMAIKKRYTENNDAQDAYFKGLYHMHLRGKGVMKALNYFEQAVDIDSRFALAFTGIAHVYNYRGYSSEMNYGMPPKEAYPLAKEAIRKALDIDDNLAEAYTQLTWTNLYYDWDMQAAEKNIKHALELNPGYSLAHQYYRDYLMILGRWDEAVEELQRARDIEPNVIVRTYLLSITLCLAGRYEEALEEAENAVEIESDNMRAWRSMFFSHYYLGNYTKAMDALTKWEELGALQRTVSLQRANLLKKLGRNDEAEKIYNSLVKQYDIHSSQTQIAEIYMYLGDYGKTFEWLDKAYEARQSRLVYIKSFHSWDPIRSDPRYKALLKKMGLPE